MRTPRQYGQEPKITLVSSHNRVEFRNTMVPFRILMVAIAVLFSQVHGKSTGLVAESVLVERSNSDAESLFEEYFQYILDSDPEYASAIGKNIHNDKLTICGVKCFEDKKVKFQDFSEKAKKLLPSSTGLTKDNLEILIIELGYQIDLIDVGNQFLPVSFLEGPQTNFFFLIEDAPTKTIKDCQDLISRYNAFSQQVEVMIELMNEGIRRGITQHEKSLKDLEKTFRKFDESPESSPFYEPFKKIDGVGSAEEVQNLREDAKKAIADKIIPGFKKLANYIETVYRKNTRASEGASTMTNGNEFYRKLLNYQVTAEVSSKDIHDMGLREVARITSEMQALISSLKLEMAPLEFNERLRNNKSMMFETKEEVLSTYRDEIENKIKPKLPQIFKNIPKEKLEVKAAPDFMAGSPKAFYVQGSGVGESSIGTFYLELSTLKDQRKYDVVSLSLHEGIPGHHMQIAYAKEQSGLPNFRKNLLPTANNAFVEGWALYSEFLGNELGLYEDPYMLYGHLSEEIFRACRLVVDTGLHAFGWTQQQAIDYMAKNSASTLDDIEKEVDRYITWPGQACSYKYGEIKFKQFRQQAQTAMGTKFDIREFHDLMLRNLGPMSFVEEKVKQYIATAA